MYFFRNPVLIAFIFLPEIPTEMVSEIPAEIPVKVHSENIQKNIFRIPRYIFLMSHQKYLRSG